MPWCEKRLGRVSCQRSGSPWGSAAAISSQVRTLRGLIGVWLLSDGGRRDGMVRVRFVRWTKGAR